MVMMVTVGNSLIMNERLIITHGTVKAITKKKLNIWNGCKLARKRTQVHVVSPDSEQDSEGGHKEPKDHSFENCRDWLHVGITKSQSSG